MSLAEDFMGAVRRAMDEEGDLLVTALREEVNTSGMTNRGRLAAGFEFAVEATGAKVTLSTTGVRYALFASAARKGIDEGTGPGYWPPESSIRRWVETKLSPPEPKTDEITYLVQRSIHKYGTPSPTSPISGKMDWARRALDRRIPKIGDAIEEEIKAEFE